MLNRRSLAIASLLALAAGAAACSSSPSSSSSNTTTSSTVAAPTTATTGAPSGPATTFGNGTYVVNTDIAPGTYVAAGGTNCYWERLSGTSGEFNDIISNESATGRTIAAIAPTDKAFTTRGCGDWKPAPTTGTPKTLFGDGTWAVGIDISPITYRSSGGSGCYWARLSGFGGTFDEIIANGNQTGPAVVTIAPTDKGFVSKRCGEWKVA
jgi:hypothetical protein